MNTRGENIKNILPIIVVGAVILSGLGSATFVDIGPSQTLLPRTVTASVSFADQPTLSLAHGYVEVSLKGSTSYAMTPGEPKLPVHITTLQLPEGSTHITVTCEPRAIHTMAVPADVAPAVAIARSATSVTVTKDASIYESNSLWPSAWFSTDLGAGRTQDDQQVLFLKVVCNAVRYTPADDTLTYAEGFDITVTYDEPATPQPSKADVYDLAIIAPEAFVSTLRPLVDHKNASGVRTVLFTVEDIYTNYAGYDAAEDVKMFILDAYQEWGIDYALLFGGLKSHLNAQDKDTVACGWTAWHVPVRYVSVPQDDDEGCLCDLYFGCILDSTGNFSSWDSNGDGYYAAWGVFGVPRDTVDMYPEVYVGRLPVANVREAKRMVDKIIAYESTSPSEKSWYSTMVGVGGKTFDLVNGTPDGEWLCDYSMDLMGSLVQNRVTCYSSNRDTGGLTPVAADIAKAFNQGAGYVDFEGHGNPFVWDTIWFDGSYPDDWCGGIHLYQFPRISNGDKAPVVIVGGCHNGMFNISILPSMKDKTGGSYFTYGIPVPVCFSWGLVIKPRGGAIAATGCTGYGMGYQGMPISLSAELEVNFFYQIGQASAQTLGQAHSGSVAKFLAEEEVGQIEQFCLTNWQLLGDPSLQLGGFA